MSFSQLRVWSSEECKTLSDQELGSLGSCLPPGFSPPCSFGTANGKTGSEAQQHDVIALIEQSALACVGPDWDEPLTLAVRGWWSSHMNAKAVEWAAALYGIPVENTKEAMVEALVVFQAMPLSWKQLRHMSGLWDKLSTEE
jgi:hypothetical protein